MNPHPPSPQPRYWFPAKRYGWGWGSPTTREGWIVLIVWILAVVSTAFLLAPRHPYLYSLSLIALTAVLLCICYKKGEPPKWRWGK